MQLRYPFLGFSRATSLLSPHLNYRHLRVLLLRQAHRHSPKNFVCRYRITLTSYTKGSFLSTIFCFFPDMAKLLSILRRFLHFLYNILFFFHIDLQSNYVIMSPSQLERVFPKQDIATAGLRRPRPYGQPGRMPKTALSGLATSVALLIELKAQFYKLVTINRWCPEA